MTKQAITSVARLRLGCWVLLLTFLLAACSQANPASAPPAIFEGRASTPGGTLGTVGSGVAPTSELLDKADSRPQIGELAPDFAYTMPDGTTYKLSELRGKKVLINFWATWCAPCKVEMPDIQRALEQYGSDQFVVLAVSNEEATVIEEFAREHAYSFPLISNSTGDILKRYGVNGFPVSFFINSDGSIDFKQIGIMTSELITQRIEDLQ